MRRRSFDVRVDSHKLSDLFIVNECEQAAPSVSNGMLYTTWLRAMQRCHRYYATYESPTALDLPNACWPTVLGHFLVFARFGRPIMVVRCKQGAERLIVDGLEVCCLPHQSTSDHQHGFPSRSCNTNVPTNRHVIGIFGME